MALPHSRPAPVRPAVESVSAMSRPIKFEEFRYVGDKRTQRYHDLDDPDVDTTRSTS